MWYACPRRKLRVRSALCHFGWATYAPVPRVSSNPLGAEVTSEPQCAGVCVARSTCSASASSRRTTRQRRSSAPSSRRCGAWPSRGVHGASQGKGGLARATAGRGRVWRGGDEGCEPPGSGPNATQQTLTGSSSNSFSRTRSTVLIAWRSWLQCDRSFLLWHLGLTSSMGWNPHWLDGRHVPSKRGLQQSDSLGPLFFVLAQQLAIEKVVAMASRESPEQLGFAVFFLDDGTVAGTKRSVAWFVASLRQELAAIGLTLNVGKSEAIPAKGEYTAVTRVLFPEMK